MNNVKIYITSKVSAYVLLMFDFKTGKLIVVSFQLKFVIVTIKIVNGLFSREK